MKIVFVNEYTAVRGGVDNVVDLQIRGLKKRGVNVDLYSIHHNELLKKPKYKLLQYLNYRKQFRLFNNYILQKKPDIIHFHNIYPLWGYPFWKNYKDHSIKIVQHLHNYYPFCLNSFFYRNSNICSMCFDNNNWLPGIKYKCYNNSYLDTFLSVLFRANKKKWLDYSKNVNLFIGVSEFIKGKYTELGLNPDKIKTLKNAVNNIERESTNNTLGDYVLYIGNIIEPKGVRIVCELAKNLHSIKFIIAGEGRDLQIIKDEFGYLKNLEFVGYVDSTQKNELLKNCRFVIFPTKLWESFGLIIIESFNYGKPVLTSGKGATSELVEHKKNGIVVDSEFVEEYQFQVKNLWNELKGNNIYRKNCLETAARYTEEEHLNQLIKYYKELL